MNLEESEIFSNELIKNNRQKKLVLLIIVLLSVILVILIAATIVVRSNEAKRFKIYYNGTEQKKLNTTAFIIQQEGEYYINVAQMANIEGYAYNPGEYKKFEETKEACNVSKDFEITSLLAGKNYFYKTIDKANTETFKLSPYGKSSEEEKDFELETKAESGSVETFETDKKVILYEEELYAPLSIIRDTFNVKITKKNNSISFESLNYLYDKISKEIVKYGYDTIDGKFENIRALVYDLVVVNDRTFQGVLSTETYKSVISSQYSELLFIQNSKEFLASAVIDGKKTVGLINSKGDTIIKPTEYDEIQVLSDKNGLYLVKKDLKCGVLNRKGEVVVYVEQDKIGLTDLSDFPLEDQTNGSVLFEKYIPIQKEGKYGLYSIKDTSGLPILRPYYDSIGYKVPENEEDRISTRETNVLSIPAELGIKGLVVELNGAYGIYDMTEESLVLPCSFEKIFAETDQGVTTYYVLEIGSEDKVNLQEYIDAYGLRNVDANGNPLKKANNENDMDVRVENGNVTEVETKTSTTNTVVTNTVVEPEEPEIIDDTDETEVIDETDETDETLE